MPSCKYCEIFKDTYFEKYLQAATSENGAEKTWAQFFSLMKYIDNC